MDSNIAIKNLPIPKEKIPDVFKVDDLIDKDLLKTYISEKAKEGFHEGFKGLMKEAFDEWLGDKKVKEIEEEQSRGKTEQERQEEREEWLRRYKAKQEEELRNPTIRLEKAAEILGVNAATLRKWTKMGRVIGEHERGIGWFFKKNHITAYKELVLQQNSYSYNGMGTTHKLNVKEAIDYFLRYKQSVAKSDYRTLNCYRKGIREQKASETRGRSFATYRCTLYRFLNFLKDKHPDLECVRDLRSTHIEEFGKYNFSRGLKESSVDHEGRWVRHLFRFLIDNKFINCFLTTKMIKAPWAYGRKMRRLVNTDSTDPYMSISEVRKAGIVALSPPTLKNYVKKGLIQHKVIYIGKIRRPIYYIRVNHLKQLLKDKPRWLEKSLKWSKACGW